MRSNNEPADKQVVCTLVEQIASMSCWLVLIAVIPEPGVVRR